MQLDTIVLVDGDTVEVNNLPRQLLYAADDVGQPKVEAAARRMRSIAAQVEWVPVFRFLDPAAAELLREGQLVVDCTDDLAARAIIERVCRERDLPMVSGAVHGHQVQVMTFHGKGHHSRRPTFFQGRASEDQLGCDMRVVPAAITTLAASLMALRISDLLQGGDGLSGVMDLVDGAHGRWMRILGPEAGEFMDTPIDPVHHA